MVRVCGVLVCETYSAHSLLTQVSSATLTAAAASPACARSASEPAAGIAACLRWILATCGGRAHAPADAGLLRKMDGSVTFKCNRFGIWLVGPAEPVCSTRSRRR